MKKQKDPEKTRNFVIRPLLKEKFTKSVIINFDINSKTESLRLNL